MNKEQTVTSNQQQAKSKKQQATSNEQTEIRNQKKERGIEMSENQKDNVVSNSGAESFVPNILKAIFAFGFMACFLGLLFETYFLGVGINLNKGLDVNSIPTYWMIFKFVGCCIFYPLIKFFE